MASFAYFEPLGIGPCRLKAFEQLMAALGLHRRAIACRFFAMVSSQSGNCESLTLKTASPAALSGGKVFGL